MESELKYHNGNVKAVLIHNHKRVFYNTGVRIEKRYLSSKLLVKKEAVPHWQALNKKILNKKSELDAAILKDMDKHGEIDLDRVKLALYAGEIVEAPVPTEVSKDDVLLADVLQKFRDTQPIMNRGLRWRYEFLQSIMANGNASNLVCSLITPKQVHEIITAFIGTSNANTAGTRYKNFKRFYNWAREDEKYPLPRFDWNRHRPSGFKPDFVYLDETKIDQLNSFEPASEHHKRIKQIFQVLIYTGMRYSDYESLTEDECANNIIEKTAQKTKVRFKVPIHDNILHIIRSRPVMAAAVFNRGVKELGKEIAEKHEAWKEVVRFQTDLQKFEMLAFHDLLCSSVGRHTFATRCLLAGIPHNVIMSMAGWSSPTLIFYYTGILKLDTIDYMKKLK